MARAWALTRALSPRAGVRTADVDAYGQALNSYSGRERHTESAAPDRPWAMYLADEHEQFHYLAFDFDASKAGAKTAAADAATVLAMLQDAGIDAVTCQSGPSLGRHVWIAFADVVTASDVDRLGRAIRHLCPSIDLSPWRPVRGCVRPPGSPHRAGGTSTVIRGSLDVLTAPTTSPDQFAAFVDAVTAAVDLSSTPASPALVGAVAVDVDGHRYLPGTRRELPARSREALAVDAAADDASAILFRILCGAARAHWHLADVAALVDEPGMAHVRTRRHQGTRLPRPARGPQSAQNVLAHQWDRAVRFVASTPATSGSDPTFDDRAHCIGLLAEQLQTRADASPGRWGSGGGPADRRVLDALHTLAVTAITPVVEADTRRVALMTGLGKSTVARALQRLAEDGWITPSQSHAGVHGAHWNIDPQNLLHSITETSGTQAATRPAGAGAGTRSTTLRTITTRLRDHTHDLFTGRGGLPLLAGNIYAHTNAGTTSVSQLTAATGAGLSDLHRILDKLVQLHVLLRTPTGWTRPRHDGRTRAAQALGVDGRLEARRARYDLDRQLWAWWQGEHERMSGSSTYRTARRHVQVTALWRNPNDDYYPRHPRRSDGRADFRAARAHLVAGALDTAEPLTIAA